MKFCYQVATPDVTYSPEITAFQGSLEESFGKLYAWGYDGVELMTRSPEKLNWNQILRLSQSKNLAVTMICTGEIFAQLGVSFCDRNLEARKTAIERTKQMIDYASYLDAIINVGRLRGVYYDDIPRSKTDSWAVEALTQLSEYADKKNAKIAIETVAAFQSNFINTLEEARMLLQKVGNPNLRIMMDIFHMHLEEPDYLSSIIKYQAYNIHVHLADSNRRYPGQGNLPFDKIVETFMRAGYDGVFTVEIMQWPDQDTAAKAAIEYMSPIFSKYYP